MSYITHISNLIESQFPDFYREEGETFIAFVKAYYEWMEQENGVLTDAYNLPSYLDIDTTVNRFIDHFKQTYMVGLPKEIVGNVRLLQKHILDLYRSKGTPNGVRLLFRLLFNESIDIYIPATDIFKLSDGRWVRRQYIEVSENDNNVNFQDKEIIGFVSKARAYVSAYEKRIINNTIIHVFFIENVRGTFLQYEPISYDGITAAQGPTIKGSLAGIVVTSSLAGFAVGDLIYTNLDPNLKLKVTSLKSLTTGIIEASIEDGGEGYRLNSNISISAGSNTSGGGAALQIKSIINPVDLVLSNVTINGYSSVVLSDADYGFVANTTTDISTPLDDALDFYTYQVGTIGRIAMTNPGSAYNGNITVEITEPTVIPLGIIDQQGNLWGNNAVINTAAVYGNNLVASVKVVSSGFFHHNQNQPVTFYAARDDALTFQGNLSLGGMGIEEGYFRGTNGFLDSNKYLTDSYYYQEFSYEVRSSKSLNQFSSILKSLVHPGGNEVFGKPVIRDALTTTTVVEQQIAVE